MSDKKIDAILALTIIGLIAFFFYPKLVTCFILGVIGFVYFVKFIRHLTSLGLDKKHSAGDKGKKNTGG